MNVLKRRKHGPEWPIIKHMTGAKTKHLRQVLVNTYLWKIPH